MAKVIYVHFGAAETEFGIDFSTDDGAGGEIRGKAYADANAALKDTVLKAAQEALDVLTGQLPVDMPPGAVTTALMQARNARQEMEKALAAHREAEEKRQAAEAAKEATDAEIAAARAEHERLAAEHEQQAAEKQAEIALLAEQAKQAEADHLQQQAERERVAAEKHAELEALNAQIAEAKAAAERARAEAAAPAPKAEK